MTNIEVFDRIVAIVFKELYVSFPKPVLLMARDIRQKAEIPDADWWESDRGSKGNSAGVAIAWLQEEGFIRYTTATSDGSQFGGAVLSSKGLAALNRTPEAVASKPTIGERLLEIPKTATKEFIGGLVRMLLSQF